MSCWSFPTRIQFSLAEKVPFYHPNSPLPTPCVHLRTNLCSAGAWCLCWGGAGGRPGHPWRRWRWGRWAGTWRRGGRCCRSRSGRRWPWPSCGRKPRRPRWRRRGSCPRYRTWSGLKVWGLRIWIKWINNDVL